MRRSRWFPVLAMHVLLLALLLLTSCPPKPVVHTPLPTESRDLGYIDLKPGWRLRVVVPILRSGGYIVPLTTHAEGNTAAVSTGKDFLGYEVDFYTVRALAETGVTIHFIRADAVVEGKKSQRTQPILSLLDLPDDAKFVRIVYLIRDSTHDHDMAILAAQEEHTLNELVSRVRLEDSAKCNKSPEAWCTWVPRGVAVIPEEKILTGKQKGWQPVR